MKISKLIKLLQDIHDTHGDILVAANGNEYTSTNLLVMPNLYYYDGGCLIFDEDSKNWVRSKNHPELGEVYCQITAIDPDMGVDEDQYAEGQLIPYMGDEWSDTIYEENCEKFKKALGFKP